METAITLAERNPRHQALIAARRRRRAAERLDKALIELADAEPRIGDAVRTLAWCCHQVARHADDPARTLRRLAGWINALIETGGRPLRAFAALLDEGVCGHPRLALGMLRTSPGRFASRLRRIEARATAILRPLGLRPWLAGLAAAALAPGKVGKAAIIAAAATLDTGGDLPYCWLGKGRERRWAWQDAIQGWIAQIRPPAEGERGTGAWPARAARARIRLGRAVGIRPPLEAVNEPLADFGESVAAAGHAGLARRLWGRLCRVAGERLDDPDVRATTLEALFVLILDLGPDRARALVQRALAGDDPAQALHDLAQGLEGKGLCQDARAWLGRFERAPIARWQVACRLATRWGLLREAGWDPAPKGALEAGVATLAAMGYEDAHDREFAREAARWGVDPRDYSEWESRWLYARERLGHQAVPAPGGARGLFRGELRIYQLAKDDPRALFVGHHTGCCQHPAGAGSSCAWHSVESPHGAVWVVELRGRILAQAWVWRCDDAIVLDNIEAMGHEGYAKEIGELFVAAAREVVARRALGISEAWIGAGMTDVPLPGIGEKRPVPFQAPAAYTDAREGWRVAG